VPTATVLTPIGKQPFPDLSPDRMRPGEPNGVARPDFHDTTAPRTANPQQFS
jgi:hypothetical protein